MGVPISEVGYTSATARRGDHESSYEHVVALEEEEKKKTFSTNLSETFLILRRIEREMTKNVHCSSCKVPVILVRL